MALPTWISCSVDPTSQVTEGQTPNKADPGSGAQMQPLCPTLLRVTRMTKAALATERSPPGHAGFTVKLILLSSPLLPQKLLRVAPHCPPGTEEVLNRDGGARSRKWLC